MNTDAQAGGHHQTQGRQNGISNIMKAYDALRVYWGQTAAGVVALTLSHGCCENDVCSIGGFGEGGWTGLGCEMRYCTGTEWELDGT